MVSNKLVLIALMGIALIANSADAIALPEKRQLNCRREGESCRVIPDLNFPRCCNFFVCDRITARCKSGIVIG